MMMSFISLGFVGVAWALIGYTLAFSGANQWIGDLANVFLNGVGLRGQGHHPLCCSWRSRNVLHHHSGVDLGRDHRADALLGLRGLHHHLGHRHLRADRALGMGRRMAGAARRFDFAGGTVVHVNAAAAAFVAAMVIGKRTDYGSSSILPHNVPFVLLGAGMLWFGWFGFNAGSALAASPQAGLAFVTTMLAPAATLVVWTLLDAMRTGKPTSVGACDGDRRRPRRRRRLPPATSVR